MTIRDDLHAEEHAAVTKLDRSFRLLLVVCAALVIGLVGVSLAAVSLRTSSQTGSCVNGVLSARNDPNAADKVATDVVIRDQAAAISEIPRAMAEISINPLQAFKDLNRAIADYQKAYVKYQATRTADDAARAAHPLGKC